MSETYDLFQLGKSHLRQGMAAQATVPLERAKRLEPNKASIREALGIAYFRIRRWEEAEAEFRMLVELAPADHYAHFALGRALDRLGRSDEASRHYKLARILGPERPDPSAEREALDPEAPDG
jgi:Flp pilus assembly protein TadD